MTYLAVLREQDTVTLDVTMNDTLGVEVDKGSQAALTHGCNLLFCETVCVTREERETVTIKTPFSSLQYTSSPNT